MPTLTYNNKTLYGVVDLSPDTAVAHLVRNMSWQHGANWAIDQTSWYDPVTPTTPCNVHIRQVTPCA